MTRAMAALRDAWPREEFPDRTIALYAAELSAYPEELVVLAVDDLVRTEKWRPSVGMLVAQVAERALNLPTEEEAWGIAERGNLRDAHEGVQRACEHVGGRYAILHSREPERVREQFLRAYRGIRRQSLLDYSRQARPALGGTQRRQLGPTMRQLPETTRIRPRPVMSRLIERWAGRQLDPPTEEEKRDATTVLWEGATTDEPKDDPLYAEAERIFKEAAPEQEYDRRTALLYYQDAKP